MSVFLARSRLLGPHSGATRPAETNFARPWIGARPWIAPVWNNDLDAREADDMDVTIRLTKVEMEIPSLHD